MEKDAPTNREPEAARVLNKLAKIIEAGELTVDRLSKRIEPVLRLNRNDVATGGAGGATVPEFNSPLAQAINTSVRQLETLINRIEDISSRVEV